MPKFDDITLEPARPYCGADLPRALFVLAISREGLRHVAHVEFAGSLDAEGLAAVGEVVLFRSDRGGKTVEALVRLGDGMVALLDVGNDSVMVEVAGAAAAPVTAAVDRLRERFGRPELEAGAVPFAFWWRGRKGADLRHATIDAPSLDGIRRNYTAKVARALAELAALEEPGAARLLVWRGPPGTGKTFAIRALARAWKDWCSAHVVLDPQRLFGADPGYLIELLTWRSHEDPDRWRLLVLEDAGDLVVRDAGGGVALAPLLNLTDGLLGQGSRLLVLITTNEPVGRLHPAVRRPGRCLSDLEFGPLSRDEARAWLRAAGSDHEPDGPLTLAELYALAGGGAAAELVTTPATTFGFARVLAS